MHATELEPKHRDSKKGVGDIPYADPLTILPNRGYAGFRE